ncbi:MAG: hypothetical protein ACT4O2_07350, partial [Beijerinckiaceae bacterium]
MSDSFDFLESEIHGPFFSKLPANGLIAALFASAILLTPVRGLSEPGSEAPFAGLSGHWSGAGTITMTDGATERIRCKASYAVNAAGKALVQTLRG